QSEITREYGDSVFYRLARGEHPEWLEPKVIENDAMARVLLAFDLKEPEACHQTYRLFEDLHNGIFARKEVDAHRIVALNEVEKLVREKLETMEDKKFAGYSLTPYLVLFLLREVLESSEINGNDFIANPKTYSKARYGRRRIRASLENIVAAIVDSLTP